MKYFPRPPRHGRTKSQLAMLFVCVVRFGTAASAQELKWPQYKNLRFGFVLSYPATLIASRAPDNGAGREFHTPDGAFSLCHHHLQEGEGW